MTGTPRGVSPEMHLEVTMLFEEYGRLLDADSLEAWTTLFVPDCRYEIMSRENIEQNLPLSLMLCDSRDMLDDRVYSLREANVFNIHYDCHIIGPVRVTPQGDGLAATAAYSLFQSIQAGETRLFSVGRYHAELRRVDNVLRIVRMRVVVDTGAILTLLATPI